MTNGNFIALLASGGMLFAASAVPDDSQGGFGDRTTDQAIQQIADSVAKAIEIDPDSDYVRRAQAWVNSSRPPNVPDDDESTPDDIADEITTSGRIPHPISRVGLVRDGADASRWIRLTRAVGAPDTCTRTSQQADEGEQWTSAVGPNFVKLSDGTWNEYRTQAPDIASTPPNVPDSVADA